MSMPTSLLAKSLRPGHPPVTLAKHLHDTEEAAFNVFRPDRRWGVAYCRFFRIPEQADGFLLNLRVTALFHDIGKANEEFQSMLTRRTDARQSLRHEHISALVLHLPAVRQWLAGCPALDLEIITAAVLSHHLKAAEDEPWSWGQPRGARRVALLLDHEQVRDALVRVAEVARIDRFVGDFPTDWRDGTPWSDALEQGRAAARALSRALPRPGRDGDLPRRQLLLAVKAGLIVADSVASGLVREGHAVQGWIDEVVHRPPLTPEELERSIIAPRLRQVGNLEPAKLHSFQTRVAKRGPRTLLLAACGAGKTLAAWCWAEQQLRERPCGRVIFLYPTRGTATEGFRDYVAWAPETDAALVHGSATYELDAMAENPGESVAGKQYADEASARLFALGLWSKRYFSATVDQFLGFMEHRYASLCLLPALADSIVILDEVHSYDESLFRTLVAFLESFDVPTLCMTATLPRSRRDELSARGLETFPGPEDREHLHDLEAKECAPRYDIRVCDDPDEIDALVQRTIQDGKRVLWVVNVVARCQALARRIGAAIDVPLICYHSRFRLVDRQRAHTRTVAAFKQIASPAIAITTQVCEMSLDLDADLLVTELAPCSALVQRFGRANRHLARGPDFRAQVLVTSPPRELPYQPEELVAARAFVAAISGKDISQQRLGEALGEHALAEPQVRATARFLTGGYYATEGSIRDESDHLVTAVLDRDLDDLERAVRVRGALDGYILSAPKRAVLPVEGRPSWLPRYLSVVSAQRYDESLGFLMEEATP